MLAFGHYLIDSSFNAASLHTPAGKRASNEARHCFKSIICAAYAAITHCTALISKYKIRKSNKRSAGSNGRPWYPIWITRVPRILETSLGRCRWSFDRFSSSPRWIVEAWIVRGEKGILGRIGDEWTGENNRSCLGDVEKIKSPRNLYRLNEIKKEKN